MIRIGQLFGPVAAQISPALRQQAIVGSQVVTDSRRVEPDSLFIAIRGTQSDGHSYVDELLRSGVLACVVDHQFEGSDPRLIRVKDTREALGWVMANVHGNPSHSMKLVGVTGTSGKTTTTYLIEHVLKVLGHRVGVIGTVNFRVGDEILPSTHTTPGSPELQALLAEMKNRGCTAVVMEVSSHALKQHRTAGIAFDAVVFTNLSREHLDFHPDMEDYFQSKKLLFSVYPGQAARAGKNCVAVVNADDPYGKRILLELGQEAASGAVRCRSYAIEDSAADLSGAEIDFGIEGLRGRLRWKADFTVPFTAPLFARFNLYNALAAVEACRALGLSEEKIAGALASFGRVPGRLERVPNALGLVVLVDYAHKPDALEKVLNTLREVRRPGQRIITVVGCGGDRDRTKRPVMGRLAAELSDWAVITSDNPRTEDPAAIIQEIVNGIPAEMGQRVRVEQDRAKAIALAIGLGSPGDLILIAGKGHEDYQILGTRKIHFDDREVAAEECARRQGG